MIDDIRKGIDELVDSFGTEHLEEGLSVILLAIRNDSQAYGLNRGVFEETFYAFLSLCDVNECIAIYEHAKKETKAKAA